MTAGADQTPFPLDGGRVGDGGETLSVRPRHRAGAVGRARHMRREPSFAEKVLWADLRKLKLNIRRQAPIGRFMLPARTGKRRFRRPG